MDKQGNAEADVLLTWVVVIKMRFLLMLGVSYLVLAVIGILL